jgi:hypothetical protein
VVDGRKNQDRFADVHPVDALSQLSERSRKSRIATTLIVIFGIIAFVFVIGFFVQMVRGGVEAPPVPLIKGL